MGDMGGEGRADFLVGAGEHGGFERSGRDGDDPDRFVGEIPGGADRQAQTPPFDAAQAAGPIWPSKAATDAVQMMTPRSPSSRSLEV